MAPHIVLTTFGSLGDLHPYIAVGMKLKERGARVTIATSEIYREKVEREGIAFHAVRPDLRGLVDDPAEIAKALHPVKGGHYIINQMMAPYLNESFEDLLPLAREADLLVSHAIAFATPVVADVLRKPWVSVVLQPMGLLSVYDPPTSPAAPWMERFRGASPAMWRSLFSLAKVILRRAGKPINALRRRVGVAPLENPIFDGMYSPHGKQAWFPGVMGARQSDWPADIEVTGYPFYDEVRDGLIAELAAFLDSGAPPVVFTMGSAAVFDAGTFYRDSAEAAERCGVRAVLLIGNDERNRPSRPLLKSMIAVPYAPYAALFPRAAAIVHQGGIGTTSQALRSGHPQMVLPYCHDQPDNARRLAALGCSLTIRRAKYNSVTAAGALTELLTNENYAAAAERAAASVRSEDGASRAADLLLKHPGIQ